jgi:hypothetical protein
MQACDNLCRTAMKLYLLVLPAILFTWFSNLPFCGFCFQSILLQCNTQADGRCCGTGLNDCTQPVGRYTVRHCTMVHKRLGGVPVLVCTMVRKRVGGIPVLGCTMVHKRLEELRHWLARRYPRLAMEVPSCDRVRGLPRESMRCSTSYTARCLRYFEERVERTHARTHTRTRAHTHTHTCGVSGL